MTRHDAIGDMLDRAENTLPLVRLIVAGADGSTPREVGAAMLVDATGTVGTIGGGQLEFEAIAHACKLLKRAESDRDHWTRDFRTWPLGPTLGQCCGGTVRLLFEVYDAPELEALRALHAGSGVPGLILHPVASGMPIQLFSNRQEARGLPMSIARTVSDFLSGARSAEAALVSARGEETAYFIEPLSSPATPLYIYGAGHVGQAIVKIVSDLDFDVHWVDTHKERFPAQTPANVTPIIARNPAIIARAAPVEAFHLVLTYSHAIDLDICRAILTEPAFGFLGLIGSQTKRSRFMKRLRDGGVTSEAIERLTCPIGIGALRGKEPAKIAVSVAAQLIEKQEMIGAHKQSIHEGAHGAGKRLSA